MKRKELEASVTGFMDSLAGRPHGWTRSDGRGHYNAGYDLGKTARASLVGDRKQTRDEPERPPCGHQPTSDPGPVPDSLVEGSGGRMTGAEFRDALKAAGYKIVRDPAEGLVRDPKLTRGEAGALARATAWKPGVRYHEHIKHWDSGLAKLRAVLTEEEIDE